MSLPAHPFRARRRWVPVLAGWMIFSIARAEPGHVFKPLTTGERADIHAAVPNAPRVSAKQPRWLLIFYRTEGFVHASIPFGNEALAQLGIRTGAYRAELSEDMAVFEPGRLARFDAVLFNNTSKLAFADSGQRMALLEYLKAGRGFIGIHAPTECFPENWPEARAMLGGVFHSHPWTANSTVAVKLDDPGHPVVAAFGGRGFWLREEIYQIVGPYSREKQRVVLSLDMSKPENRAPAAKFVRTDDDFPISWVKQYDGGARVFYSSLGHNNDVYTTPQVLQHYLDGIQFALGDLAADAIPSARVSTPPRPALAPADRTTLQQLAAAARAAAGNDGARR